MSWVVIDSMSFSPQLQSWVNRLSNKPSNGFLLKTDKNLIKPLIAAGIWDQLDYFALYATESQSQALVPLKNTNTTTYNATAVNSLTFSPMKGVASDGTSYINTNWTASTHASRYTQNSACIGAYAQTAPSLATRILIGVTDLTRTNSIFMTAGGTVGGSVNDNTNAATALTFTAGLYHIERTSSTVRNYYRNGSQFLNNNTASTTVPTMPEFVLAYSQNGTPQSYFTGVLSCAYLGSSSINATQIYNILLNYGRIMGWA